MKEKSEDDGELEAESLEDESYSGILESLREVNQIGFELDCLRSEDDTIESDLASIEAEIEDVDTLEAERGRVASELQDLRKDWMIGARGGRGFQ